MRYLVGEAIKEGEFPSLANKDDPQWEVIVADINYEDNMLYCDHCSQRIDSAYGDE